MSIAIDEREKEAAPYEPPLMAHIGLVGDKTGLCGAPTLGIKAERVSQPCNACTSIWDAMGAFARFRFRRGWR